MNKISKEITIGFGLIFSISFWAAVDGKISFLFLLVPIIGYAIMYFCIKFFINRDKPPVKSRFSVSLVYAKYDQKSSDMIEYTTSLRVLITDAYSKDEALGKAFNEFNDKEKENDFRLTNQCVLPVNIG